MISLVLPTFNEAQNLAMLVDLVDGALRDQPHEIIIVDDNSPDGTWRVAQSLTQQYPSVRVLRRIGKKGLSSAVVDGFDAAVGDRLVVMDADGQHDAALLRRLLDALEQGADLSIGSRYVSGGSVGEWIRGRRIISKTGTFFAAKLSHVSVSDPLGGFFALRTTLYKQIRSRLHPTGFKILLEILANVPQGTRLAEIPLVFRMRLHGESKLSLRVHRDFLFQVLRLSFRRTTGLLCLMSLVLFWTAALAIVLSALPRAWAIRPMFFDPTLRSDVRAALVHTADKQGWLLSDIELLSVSADQIRIRHKNHLRTPTPATSCSVTLHPFASSCAAD